MLKEALVARRLFLDDVIMLMPPGASTARAFDVITWAPYFGRVKAERLLKRLGEPMHRQLDHMPRQRRRELVALITRENPKALYGAAHREYIC